MTDGPARRAADGTALSDRPAFFEALVYGTSDAVVAFEGDGAVAFANAGVASLLGRDPDDLVGADVDVLFPDRHAGWLAAEVAHYREAGRGTVDWNGVEFPLRRADGSEVAASLTLAPHELDGRQFFSLVARDVDAHVERRERLAAELKRRERAIEEFLAAVEGPLSAAEAALSAADEGDDDLDGRDVVEAVADAHDHVAAAVEEWFADAGDDGAEEPPKTRTVSLSDIAADAWDGGGDGAVLRVDALGSVDADPDGMRALLGTLFAAARRHCGDGVTVHVGPLSNGFYVATDRPGVPPTLRAAVEAADGEPRTGSSGGDAGPGDAGSAPDGDGEFPTVARVVAAHGWSTATVTREDGGTRFEFRSGA